MKSDLFLFLVTSIILGGCKVKSGELKQVTYDCTQDLAPLIKNNWTYIENGNYYIMNDTLRKALENKFYNCIIQKDTAWLVEKLGKHENARGVNETRIPNDKTIGAISYQLSPQCTCKNTRCTFYFFYYDSTGKITKHHFDEYILSCQD